MSSVRVSISTSSSIWHNVPQNLTRTPRYMYRSKLLQPFMFFHSSPKCWLALNMSMFTDQDPLRALQWKFTHIPGLSQLQLWSPNPTSNPDDPFVRVCCGQGYVHSFLFLDDPGIPDLLLLCSARIPWGTRQDQFKLVLYQKEQLLSLIIFFHLYKSQGREVPQSPSQRYGWGHLSPLRIHSDPSVFTSAALAKVLLPGSRETTSHLEIVTWGCQQQHSPQKEIFPLCQAADVFDKPKVSVRNSKDNSSALLTKGQ